MKESDTSANSRATTDKDSAGCAAPSNVDYDRGYREGVFDAVCRESSQRVIWSHAASLVALTGLKPGHSGYAEALELALEQIRDSSPLQREGSSDLITLTGEALIDGLNVDDTVGRAKAFELPLPVMADYVCDRIRRYGVDAAVVREREVCAELAEDSDYKFNIFEDPAKEIAEAIRARGQQSQMNGTYTMSYERIRSESGNTGHLPSKVAAPEEYPAIGKVGVTVNGIYYGIGAGGIFRNHCDGNEADFAFALPVAAYLKEKGLDSGNIESVTWDDRVSMVLYRWVNVEFCWFVLLNEWSMPIVRGRLRGTREYVDPRTITHEILDDIEDELQPDYNVPIIPDVRPIKGNPISFDSLGIPSPAPACSRCGGQLSGDRVSVCDGCEPSRG